MWKNRRWYALLLLLTLYLALFYNSYAIMLIVYIEVLFPIVSFICALSMKMMITVELNADKPAIMKNEDFGIDIIFKNDSIFPASRISLNLVYHNQFTNNIKKEAYSISLENKCILKMMCEVPSEYCGNIEFGIADMKIYDMLGLFGFKISAHCTNNVSVLPDMAYIAESMLRGGTEVFLEEEVYSTRRSGDDPSEIFRVRDYSEGDRMNRIHWKLSAKEGVLIVKDFGLPLDSSVVILIEMNCTDENTEQMIDAAIESAAALSQQFILMRQIHFIVWYDIYIDDMVRIRIENEDDLYETLAHIYSASVYKEAYLGLVTYQEKYRTEQYSNLFYITAAVVKDEIDMIREFAKAANCHVVLITDTDDISDEYKNNFLKTDLTYSLIHPKTLIEDIGNMDGDIA